MLDLDAYLERIGLSGRPSIAQVHRAHLTSIPFENLDPHQGLPVSLDVEDLERKLITRHRGGYSFEQNLLLKAALEALGAEVDMFLARSRLDTKPGQVWPRSHLVLRVTEHGASWHADVGFGARGILDPIPFGPGPVQEQSGWSFRVVQDGSELVLQRLANDAWVELYSFVPQPVALIDVEVSNWWTCTNPRSRFVAGLIVGAHSADGTSTVLCDWSELALSEQTPAYTSVTAVEREAVPELLATRFSLPGFILGTVERLVRAPTASLARMSDLPAAMGPDESALDVTPLEAFLRSEVGYPPSARGLWLQEVAARGGLSVEELSGHLMLRGGWRNGGGQGAPEAGPLVARALAPHVAGPRVGNLLALEALADSREADADPAFREAVRFLEKLVVLARTDSYEWLRERGEEADRFEELPEMVAYLKRHGLARRLVKAALAGCGPLPATFMTWSRDTQRAWVDAYPPG